VARPRDIAGSRTGRQRQREEDRERGEQEGGRKNRERRGEKGAGRGTVCLCAFKGSRTGSLGQAPLWQSSWPRIAARKERAFATGDGGGGGERQVYAGKTTPAFRRSVPLCPGITRQKYCDWPTIGYDVTWAPIFRPERQWGPRSDAHLPNQADRDRYSPFSGR